MELIINLIIVGLILGLTYALTSEGLWGAALMFFNVLFGALIALNFYEPLAVLLDSTGIGWGFSDTLCMMGLFCVATLLLRMTTETIAPAQVRFPVPVYQAGRLIFGLGGAVITMAMVLLALHAAPIHKKILYHIDYQSAPPFHWGIDHKFLSFFQHTTGAPFAQYGSGRRDPFQEYGNGRGGERYALNLFDPRAEWLIKHQEARPYGNETILGGDEAAAEGEAGGGEGGAPAMKGAAPAGGGPIRKQGGRRGGDGPPN